ncbi:hypothetical protein ACYSNO_01615 [Enterococcus sp. LJL98]
MCSKSKKDVYIVLSSTDTVLGKMIQKKLGVSYNHCSISLDENLERIYSFGRKSYWHMFSAGFVHESKSSGFYKKYQKTRIVVLRISVTKKQWYRIKRRIALFSEDRHRYSYSLIGLIYCDLGMDIKRKNKYFCSQFVTEVLHSSGVTLFKKPETLIKPHDYLKLPQIKIIYRGEIGAYTAA